MRKLGSILTDRQVLVQRLVLAEVLAKRGEGPLQRPGAASRGAHPLAQRAPRRPAPSTGSRPPER